ncbi:uncharacterized protein LOC134227749 [Armigeres subalbatus]|uniref:uncharacterized protein LOC134227749 n=1 Tax=Armigeres subalbatus TaxID=124917 RepID=UPI002ED1EBC3
MKPRKASGNLKTPSAGSQSTEVYEDVEVLEGEGSFEMSANNLETFEVAESSPQSSKTPPVKKFKKSVGKNIHTARLLDIEQRKLELLEKKVTSRDRDEDEAFFDSLLPHVKKLNPPAKFKLRMELQQIVLEHVYGSTSTSGSESTVRYTSQLEDFSE